MANRSRHRADRISSLDISLLHHILSFVPTKEVVRTCILSKKWNHIWCSIPSFDLDETLFTTENDFIKFVNTLLILRDGSNIQKLHLCLWEDEQPQFRKDVLDTLWNNVWIKYALRKNVEVIHLDFLTETILTPLIFICESLREFKLNGNYLFFPSSIFLPALRFLHLVDVHVWGRRLDDAVFSSIPVLETLILDNCDFEDHESLTISTPQLQTLVLTGVFPPLVEISAPNLTSLNFSPIYEFPEVKFNNELIHLIYATLHLPMAYSKSMIHLFQIIKNTHSLSLSGWFFESSFAELQHDLYIPLSECIQAPFYSLRCFKFGTIFSDSDILLINTILDHSPCVETIVLQYGQFRITTNTKEEHFEFDKIWFKYNLSHLRSVEIPCFLGSDNEVKLVKFFLENALVLERLIVTASMTKEWNSEHNKELRETIIKLLAYPRASSCARILFQ